MNWDQFEGNWMQVKGKVRERWGDLTDDELEQIAGKKDQLLGKLQERYGFTKEQAQKELEEASRTW
ncbi:MAG: CsbD family protein [Isosphaeraceae bacterium]